ncbi:MAG: hypothetical protein M3R08_03115, partial [Bacteroidota bacterium]|nr:hypothetical protein [Bacteroidota bacterium]
FIATGDGDGEATYSAGVLRSYDGGTTWEPTGLDWNITSTRTTRSLKMDPEDPANMYCAASDGLYHTTDGAGTWSLLTNGSFRDVEFKPGDTAVVYACTDQFYRSNDGITFIPNSTGLPLPSVIGRMAIAVSPADPLAVYVLCSSEDDDSFLGLYYSNNGGSTFQLRSDSPNLFAYSEFGDSEGGQAWYDMALAVDPLEPNVIYIGGINVWKSTDGGSSWTIRSHWIYPSSIGYTHADIHFLEVLNNRVYCGSDGGVFLSEDAGHTWQDRSAGLDITQFYRLGGSELIPDLVMAGAQDNGSNQFVNADWTHVYGGDGMEAAVDIFDPYIIYTSSQRGGLKRSDDGGFSFVDIAGSIYEEGAWVTPFVLDPLQPMNLIAGYKNLWHSDFLGEYWEQITFWNDEEFVRCIAYAPMHQGVIYAARNDLVQRSLDGGSTWENFLPGLPELSPTSIAVDHFDAMHVWISFSGTSPNEKVYESLNGGFTWINRSAGLPNIPANSIVIQPYSSDAVYLGTDMGVFYMNDMEPQWQIFGEGLPNVVVSELEINVTTGKLRAATYGRGIWQADLNATILMNIDAIDPSAGPSLMAIDQEGRFMIGMLNESDQILNVQGHDAMGRSINIANGRNYEVLDLGSFAKGPYLITITTNKGRWVRRVMR